VHSNAGSHILIANNIKEKIMIGIFMGINYLQAVEWRREAPEGI
jgi:hypothetical protein